MYMQVALCKLAHNSWRSGYFLRLTLHPKVFINS